MGFLERIYTAILESAFPVISVLSRFFSALWRMKDTKFGKMIGWSAVAGSISYITGVFWAGVSPALSFFKALAADPQFAFSGLPASGSLSLSWFWDYASAFVPDAVRWLLWWIGADWWVWLATSALALWFAGWLLSKVGDWMGAIVERVCQLL